MTQEEFEAYYIRGQLFPVVFGETHVSMRCNCDTYPYEHWAAIRNNPDAIKDHLELEQWRLEEKAKR